jgi:ribosomal protein L37AE/L43A
MTNRRTGPSGAGFTKIFCPQCGHATTTSLRTGDAIIYCRKCKREFDVKIGVTGTTEGEGSR